MKDYRGLNLKAEGSGKGSPPVNPAPHPHALGPAYHCGHGRGHVRAGSIAALCTDRLALTVPGFSVLAACRNLLSHSDTCAELEVCGS